jgi:hypothetical protein
MSAASCALTNISSDNRSRFTRLTATPATVTPAVRRRKEARARSHPARAAVPTACRNGHYQKDSEVGKVVARHPCGRADPERGDGASDADQAHEKRASRGSWVEPVADAPHGHKPSRTRGHGLDLLAKASDVDRYR